MATATRAPAAPSFAMGANQAADERSVQEIMDAELALHLQEELNMVAEHEFLAADEDDAAWKFSFNGDAGRRLLSADDYDYAAGGMEEDEADDYFDGHDDFAVAPTTRGHVGSTEGANSVSGTTSLREGLRRQAKEEKRRRAPQEVSLGKYKHDAEKGSLFDERTKLMLVKMINQERLVSIETRLHYGREANVYYAIGRMDDVVEAEHAVALKIFKTSRDDYTKSNQCDASGRRYDARFVKKTMQRQMKLWAEHEHRALHKARSSGVTAPKPFMLRDHVLAMEFVGSADGVTAPVLKLAPIKRQKLLDVYFSVLLSMRRLYQKARLVHGSLGDDNMLWHKDAIYFIGFGSAIARSQPDHESALDRDIESVYKLFEGLGLRCGKESLWPAEIAKKYVMAELVEVRELLRGFCRGGRLAAMIDDEDDK